MPRDSDAHRGGDEPGEDLIPVPVWDLPTRLFHWSLVILVCTSWGAGVAGFLTVHMLSGLAILSLVLFRLVWGVIGSTTARFSHFLQGPRAALDYLAELTGRRPASRWAGHNPVGGWMIAVLLLVLLVQTGSGLFANDDITTSGPLAHLVSKAHGDTLTTVHKVSFKLLLGLVGTHILAALFYLVVKRENLIIPMVTGRKPWPPAAPRPPLHFTNPLWALPTLSASAAAVWLLVTRL
ncbi:MAG: cytochrome b/b6 domain-containing protein [Alphaproteobacteria bacterium]